MFNRVMRSVPGATGHTRLIDHKQGGDNGVYFLVKVNLSGSTFDKLQGYIIVKYGHI